MRLLAHQADTGCPAILRSIILIASVIHGLAETMSKMAGEHQDKIKIFITQQTCNIYILLWR